MSIEAEFKETNSITDYQTNKKKQTESILYKTGWFLGCILNHNSFLGEGGGRNLHHATQNLEKKVPVFAQ